MILFKYDGPVLDGNNKVRNNNWQAYIQAYSISQALLLLSRRYKKQNPMCSFCKLKHTYLKEVN